MNLTCSDCGHVFQIDKAKIPSQTFNVKCPNCKKVFQVSVHADAAKSPEKATNGSGSWEHLKPEVEAAVKKQLEDVRRDILLSVASLVGHPSQAPQINAAGFSEKRALVCEPDTAQAQQILFVLQRLGYAVQISSHMTEALSRLEIGFYDVITTNLVFPDDPEGGYKILSKLNGRKTADRRKMFVVVISEQIRTLPPQAAFFQGVNISVQKSELQNFERLFQEGLHHFSELYGTFYRLLEEATERL